MQCPRCKFNGSRVIDSRPADDGRSIRRRRECDECGYRFTTFERLEKAPILVIKRNGNREAFSREKLLNGLVRSAEKRPIPLSQLEQIVNEIRFEDIQGISAVQCGNYKDHSLFGAKEYAKQVLEQGISIDPFERKVI